MQTNYPKANLQGLATALQTPTLFSEDLVQQVYDQLQIVCQGYATQFGPQQLPHATAQPLPETWAQMQQEAEEKQAAVAAHQASIRPPAGPFATSAPTQATQGPRTVPAGPVKTQDVVDTQQALLAQATTRPPPTAAPTAEAFLKPQEVRATQRLFFNKPKQCEHPDSYRRDKYPQTQLSPQSASTRRLQKFLILLRLKLLPLLRLNPTLVFFLKGSSGMVQLPMPKGENVLIVWML